MELIKERFDVYQNVRDRYHLKKDKTSLKRQLLIRSADEAGISKRACAAQGFSARILQTRKAHDGSSCF